MCNPYMFHHAVFVSTLSVIQRASNMENDKLEKGNFATDANIELKEYKAIQAPVLGQEGNLSSLSCSISLVKVKTGCLQP